MLAALFKNSFVPIPPEITLIYLFLPTFMAATVVAMYK
jgi:hypothetical protein